MIQLFGSPSMEMVQLNGPTATTSDFIIGELIVGQTSGASAVSWQKLLIIQLYVIFLKITLNL